MTTSSSPAPLTSGLQLAVIIPTFNEVDNMAELVSRLDHVLAGVQGEAIFVDDDSPDGTAARVRELSQSDPRVRCIRRVGRRGLSSACVEGMLSTHAPYLAVMDADLQHDEALLAPMLRALQTEPVDIVIGTRYMEGGGVADWQASRQHISLIATRMSQRILKVSISDPMSGFFMLRRDCFEASVYRLSSIGFKILVDLLVSSPQPMRVKELPFHFRLRHAGRSKLDNRVAWDYLMLLADKTIGHWVPVRFISFGLIGASGVVVHLAVLKTLLSLLGSGFTAAQTIAVMVAMVGNFFLNNALTYRDQRLKGWGGLAGLLKFMAACGIGAVANVGVASYMYGGNSNWLLSSLAGIVVGTAWNYGATAWLVWMKPKRT